LLVDESEGEKEKMLAGKLVDLWVQKMVATMEN
jgi:hypothetical protein